MFHTVQLQVIIAVKKEENETVLCLITLFQFCRYFSLIRRLADSQSLVLAYQTAPTDPVRAEPVAALYEQGRVHHLQPFPELEDEICLMGVPGVKKSPDRADALVWAVTELLLTSVSAPRLRHL